MTTQTPATATPSPTTPAEDSPTSSSLPLAGETVSGPSRLAGTFLRWKNFIAAIREFVRGEIPVAMTGERRGHLLGLCSICENDIHDIGETCPRSLDAQCDICGTVALDRYMCCPHGKSESHHIVKSSIRPRLAPPTPLNEEMVMSG